MAVNIGRYFEWPSEEVFSEKTIRYPMSSLSVFVEDQMIAGLQVTLGEQTVSPLLGKSTDYLALYETNQNDSKICKVGLKFKALPQKNF